LTFEFSHLCSSAEPEKTAQFALQIINTVGWSTRSTTFDTIQAIEATSCLSGATSLIADINMDGDLYIDLIDDDLGDLSVLSQL
jgi:hypothetical protein